MKIHGFEGCPEFYETLSELENMMGLKESQVIVKVLKYLNRIKVLDNNLPEYWEEMIQRELIIKKVKNIEEIQEILLKLVNKSENEKFNKNLLVFLFKRMKRNHPTFLTISKTLL